MVSALKKEESIKVKTPFFDIDDANLDDELFEKNCASVIENANFVVFLISEKSRTSNLCKRSIKYALSLNKRILVARSDSKPLFCSWIEN